MAEPDPGFDPSHVPPFPVLTLHLDEDMEQVTLDGAPVRPDPDQSVRDAGIHAVVRQLVARDLEAVRVRVTTPGDDEWRMVVTADGTTHDTTPQEEAKARGGLTRRRLLLGGGALAVLGLAGGAVAVPRLLTPDAPPTWNPPGAGAQIPVATPPGFAQDARWALTVGRSTDLCRLSSGHIGTVSQDGVLTMRHPETAEPQWSGAAAPENISGLRRTWWDEQEVVAVASQTQLTLWPLSTASETGPVSPTNIRLETDHRAETGGPRPFVELTEWFVDLPAANLGTRRITIPAGTRAALRQEDGTLHAVGADRVHHLRGDGHRTGDHKLDMEDRPAQMPRGVWALGENLVLAVWEAEGSRLALIRPTDGTVVLDQTVKERIDQSTKVRYLGGECILLSRTVVGHGNAPFARTMEEFVPTAAHGNTLYGTHESRPATVEMDEDAGINPWRGYREDDPPPRIVTDQGAYIVAPQLEETVAYYAARV